MANIMTTKEVATYLKFHIVTIHKKAKSGEIPAFRAGSIWRYDKDAIDEWFGKGGDKPPHEQWPCKSCGGDAWHRTGCPNDKERYE